MCRYTTLWNNDITVDCLTYAVGVCEAVSVEPRRQSLDTLPPDVPWYRSCRVLLTFVTAWGYIFFYLLRVNLSIAIVCMVRDPGAAVAGHDNASDCGNGSTASVWTLLQQNSKRRVDRRVERQRYSATLLWPPSFVSLCYRSLMSLLLYCLQIVP